MLSPSPARAIGLLALVCLLSCSGVGFVICCCTHACHVHRTCLSLSLSLSCASLSQGQSSAQTIPALCSKSTSPPLCCCCHAFLIGVDFKVKYLTVENAPGQTKCKLVRFCVSDFISSLSCYWYQVSRDVKSYTTFKARTQWQLSWLEQQLQLAPARTPLTLQCMLVHDGLHI